MFKRDDGPGVIANYVNHRIQGVRLRDNFPVGLGQLPFAPCAVTSLDKPEQADQASGAEL